MLKSCTKRYRDESGETDFRFVFYCDLCGRPERSTPVPFSGGVCAGKTAAEKQLWEMRWKLEHQQAFERASQEALHRLYPCPRCARTVCAACVTRPGRESERTWELCWECASASREKECRETRFHALPAPEGRCLWRKITGCPR